MSRKSVIWLLLLAFMGVLLFALLPIIQVIIPTFQTRYGFWGLYSTFLRNTYNWQIIGRTFFMAIITAILVLILGLPTPLRITRQKKSIKQILMILILFPMLTNAAVRNFTRTIILGRDDIVNKFLLNLHLINHPLLLLYINLTIVIGSIYLFLPVMIVTLTSNISEPNLEVEEAAVVLGSTPLQTSFKIIIPQLTTGISAGCTLVFAGTMTAYTIPQILGGNRHLVMSTLIYQQAMILGNWQRASVIALILIIISALSMRIMRRINYFLDRRPSRA